MTAKILKDDHAKLAELLQSLQSEFHGDDRAQAFHSLDLFWALLAMHIRAEHLWLFPEILKADRHLFGRGAVPSYTQAEKMIEQLKSDHNFFMDELAEAVKAFRHLLAESLGESQVSAQVESIQTRVKLVALRLESHNLLEENQVYQWTGLILTPEQQDQLNRAMKRELANLPARFRTE
jgi:hemerythrin superfamily protein